MEVNVLSKEKMGRLEGALDITEHTGFQIVSYKILGSMGMLMDWEWLNAKDAGTCPYFKLIHDMASKVK